MTTENETANSGPAQPASDVRDHDALITRLSWADGAIGAVVRDPELDEEVVNALAGAAQKFLEEAEEFANRLRSVRNLERSAPAALERI